MAASQPAPPPSPTKSPNAADAASPSAGSGVRVLFLDVDGVVCCNDRGILEKDKMQLLKRIRDETGCKVCLSTNWRLYDDLRHEVRTARANPDRPLSDSRGSRWDLHSG